METKEKSFPFFSFFFFFGLKIYVHVGRVKINFSQKTDTWDRFAFVREYRKMFDEFDEFFSYFFNISFRRVFFDSMFFEISRWNSGCIFIENEDVLYGFVDLSTRNALSSLIKNSSIFSRSLEAFSLIKIIIIIIMVMNDIWNFSNLLFFYVSIYFQEILHTDSILIILSTYVGI